jgi:hypothetical protein
MSKNMNQSQPEPTDVGLRIITSWGKSPVRGNLFIMDSAALYRDFNAACARFARQGFNTLYFLSNPYRSPEGVVPWEMDLTPDDADFARAAAVGDAERQREEAIFARILESMRQHNLKALFNAGVWSSQVWFRAHPEAISLLPDQTPQFDKNFLGDGARVFNPCFRSPEFLDHVRNSTRAWMRSCAGNPDFSSILCRVELTDTGELRLAGPDGMPLFIEHQDTHDRDWCHCTRCERDFRKYLQAQLRDGATASSLGLSSGDVSSIHLPLSPGINPDGPFADRAIPNTPEGERFWLAASKFWTAGVAQWTRVIRDTLREFYPRTELATISKYPVCQPLTNYPQVARGNKIFLMDSYPMESGTYWNLARYTFDIEVYQSSTEPAGQALMAHTQAYDNPRPGHLSRPPTPGQFLQQHVACLSRGVTTVVDFAMEHAVDLFTPGDGNNLLPDAEVDQVVESRQAILAQIEPLFRGTRIYRGGVVLRYHLPSLCGRKAGPSDESGHFPGYQSNRVELLLSSYRSWKDRGAAVCVAWDEQNAEPTLPDHHEFQLQGTDVASWDLFIRIGKNRYVVSLINLLEKPRHSTLAISLSGQEMRNWRLGTTAGATPASRLQGDTLQITCAIDASAWTVFELLGPDAATAK